MPRMTSTEIEAFLALPLVPVLAVSRRDRGPVAVPIWYGYDAGVFSMITAPDSVHGRIMQQAGRATLTFHDEHYAPSRTVERYVHAEGQIRFVDDDITSVVIAHRRRYYTGPNAEEWINQPLTEFNLRQKIALLEPDKVSGYVWEATLQRSAASG